MKCFFLLAIFLVLSNFSTASFPDSDVQDLWNLFKSIYNKTYSSDEDNNRKAIFNTTLDIVAKHNIEADLGLHSYRQGVNIFADLSLDEIITGFNVLPRRSFNTYTMIRSENDLKIAIGSIGTVSVAYNANTKQHSYYQSGILDIPNCPTTPTHAALVVGYGTENGKDFWKIKNSWGTGWGENGFFRIVRGKNMCGIATGFNIQTQIELLPGLLI